jgi:hypothetical protein
MKLEHPLLSLWLFGRVTRLGKILPFGILFKGPGKFLGENMVCCDFRRGLMRMFWTFKLIFDEHIFLAFFGLATVLATFYKIGVNISPIFWSPWPLETAKRVFIDRLNCPIC